MEFLDILSDLHKTNPGSVPGSISRVNTLYNCPFQWKSRYIDRIKGIQPESSLDTETGKFLHRVTENYMLYAVRAKYDLSGVFQSAWKSAMYGVGKDYSMAAVKAAEGELSINTNAIMEKMVKDVVDLNFNPMPEIRISSTLDKRIVPMVSWRNALWCSIIDLCSVSSSRKLAHLTDYKSHSSSVDIDTIKSKEARQIKTYALFTLLLYPNVNVVKQNIAYIGDRKIVYIDEAHRDNLKSLCDDFTEYIAAYRDLVKSTKYEATESLYCKWCGYPHLCGKK